jgi:hypothetical protein
VGSDTKPSLMRATAQASLGAGERIRTADLPFTRGTVTLGDHDPVTAALALLTRVHAGQ